MSNSADDANDHGALAAAGAERCGPHDPCPPHPGRDGEGGAERPRCDPHGETGRGKRFLNAPVWVWIAFALVSALFVLVPEIDLAVSGYFYTPGVGFAAKGSALERLIHGSVGFLLVFGNAGLIALLIFARTGHRVAVRFTAKELAFLLLLLALGPGLIVNALLKENWGRARPAEIAQFGGNKAFSAAFVPSDQAGKSFSSGHAAASAYWVIAALLLAPGRIWLLCLAVAYSLVVSWMRLAAGGHFLSDILTSYFVVAILALALYGVFHGRR